MDILKKVKKEYDDKSIQTKFAICILIAILTPFIVLGSAFYNRIYDVIATDMIRKEQEAALHTVPIIEQMLQQITKAGKTVAGYLHQGEVCQQEFIEEIDDLEKMEEITQIKIYVDLPTEHLFFEEYTQIYEPIAKIKGTYWYGIFQGSKPKELYCPPFYLGTKEKEEHADCSYVIEETINYRGKTYTCYVVVYYDSSPITAILQNGISFPESVSYIINEREAVIASSDAYLTGMYYVQYADINNYLMSSNNFIESTVLDKKIYVGFNRIQQTEWFLVTITPSKPLFYETVKVLILFIIICLCCIVFAYVVAMWQTKSITVRIADLAKQMAEGRKGTPVSMPEPSVHDEIGDLIDTYNYMTGRINQLLLKQKETAEELRIAEFNSLQAQINPHFLYNTMDMINWMAMKGQTSEISSVVQQMARFYKLTLSRKSNFLSLEEELEHVSIYVELQNMRFNNAIEFVVDVPDECMNYCIPKLTLQPIVENAILHGIREKENKSGSIVITAWREGEDYILVISDDGVGMEQEQLKGILRGEKIKETKGTNIAICNIHRRLEILYGAGYGLQYASRVLQGTDVTIKMPVNM